jgi:hypothetical protein
MVRTSVRHGRSGSMLLISLMCTIIVMITGTMKGVNGFLGMSSPIREAITHDLQYQYRSELQHRRQHHDDDTWQRCVNITAPPQFELPRDLVISPSPTCGQWI